MLHDIDTPALIVDANIFEQNIIACFTQFAGTQVKIRPHLKTAKTPIVAHKLIQSGAYGVCVAKVSEAEVMANAGVEDILITTEIIGTAKIARLVRLVSRHPQIQVVVDSVAGATALSDAAIEAGVCLNILIDINVGQDRCGIDPASASTFAQHIENLPGLRLQGVQGYEGHLQHVRNAEERRQRCSEAMERLENAIHSIRQVGIPLSIVSTGGTGTCEFCARYSIVTEVQPGSFIFMDTDYLNTDKLPYKSALTVLATVISAPSPQRVIVDAGMKSLSTDSGFASAKDLPGWQYHPTGDEHGILTLQHATTINDHLFIGDRVELIPSHIDTTVNLHDIYHVHRNGMVEEMWAITARGKVQ